MALAIATNTAALTAASAASSVNRDIGTSMARLSSGKRINSASDDAAGVAIASRLYAEIRGTKQAIRNDDGSKYSGEWQANKRHGEGIYIYATGNKYKGQFKADKRHGLGTFTWTDGESYVGYWRYDTPNGQGTRNFSNGSVKSGIWKNGKFQPSKKFNPSVFALSPKQSAKEISAS